MSDRDFELNDNTKVPLAWLVATLGTALALATGLIFVGMWAGTTDTKANTALQKIDKMEQAFDTVNRIDRRLSRIEGKLGIPEKE